MLVIICCLRISYQYYVEIHLDFAKHYMSTKQKLAIEADCGDPTTTKLCSSGARKLACDQ